MRVVLATPRPVVWVVLLMLAVAGCRSTSSTSSSPAPERRVQKVTSGTDIIVAGQRFPVGTRVVTWQDAGGYNGYDDRAAFSRRNLPVRANGLPALADLRGLVDQFVLHYDASGLSKVCFNVLKQRRLSVHFLLDVDGTIYQTLDVAEKASHATVVNNRSIGVEIANIGAYPPNERGRLDEWYQADASGQTRLVVPARIHDPGIFTPGFAGRPARPGMIRGRLQDTELVQYDFTPQQYEALAKLIAGLSRALPKLKIDFPRTADGRLRTGKLPDRELAAYRGVLGHFHVQENKLDPGPALQWQSLIENARRAAK